MAWHFTTVDHDSVTLTDPTSMTVQSHGELTDLQIFVREVLQNSLDNRSGSEPVRVDFRLHYLKGSHKERFLKTLEFERILPHINSVRNFELRNKKISQFRDPQELFRDDYILKLLYLEDYGSIGLVGPEHMNEADHFAKPHCFLGLCRNVGQSEKKSEAMGGTFGFGKTVLWKYSRYGTVLFHSQLSSPYITIDEKQKHSSRFFGHIRLPGHSLDREAYSGEGFWGTRKGLLTWSLLDESADTHSDKFGMTPRKLKEAGTSILIVDFQDPDAEGEAPEQETLTRIREAAELYFWPALTEGALTIRTKTQGGATQWQSRDVIEVPYLKPFMKAYVHAGLSHGRPMITIKKIESTVPKGPGESDSKCSAALAVCVAVTDDPMEKSLKYLNRTALIRGSGMVVGYQKVGRPGFGGKDYHAVVLGGRACPPDISAGKTNQDRLEQLLAYSEPVTHDTWTQNAEKLRSWYGARAEITRILGGIRKSISEATTEDVRPEGRAISLLSKFFPLAEGSESEILRDTNIEFITEPILMESKNGQVRYQFHIRIRVPARDKFSAWIPERWRVECNYGFYGEDTHRKVVETAPVRFTHYKENGSGWIEHGQPHLEKEVQASEVSYELLGETDPLESFLARFSKHELQIKVSKE